MAGAPAHISRRLTTGPDVGFTHSIVCQVGDVAGTGASEVRYVTLPVNNGDWYLEDILLVTGTGHTADNTNYWTLNCVLYSGGSAGASVFKTVKDTTAGGGTGDPGTLLDHQWVSLAPNQNQALTSANGDNTIGFTFTESGTAVTMEGVTLTFVIRRKL